MPHLAVIIAAFYGSMSIVTAVVFGWDKRCARLGRRRISERRLHTLSLAGGWPGALTAMQLFKHKRRKRPFVRLVWGIAALHVALWGAAAYLVHM